MTGQRYITVEIDGNPTKFHKMTPYDRVSVEEKLIKEGKERLINNLTLTQVPKETFLAELETYDLRSFQFSYPLLYVFRASGRLDTFLRGLQPVYGTESETILKKFTPTEQEELELAADLWGVELPAPKVKEETQEEESKEADKKEDKPIEVYGDTSPPEANPTAPEDCYNSPNPA